MVLICHVKLKGSLEVPSAAGHGIKNQKPALAQKNLLKNTSRVNGPAVRM